MERTEAEHFAFQAGQLDRRTGAGRDEARYDRKAWQAGWDDEDSHLLPRTTQSDVDAILAQLAATL